MTQRVAVADAWNRAAGAPVRPVWAAPSRADDELLLMQQQQDLIADAVQQGVREGVQQALGLRHHQALTPSLQPPPSQPPPKHESDPVFLGVLAVAALVCLVAIACAVSGIRHSMSRTHDLLLMWMVMSSSASASAAAASVAHAPVYYAATAAPQHQPM